MSVFQLVAWASDEMADYKVPHHVRVVDALPLNANGKVVKFELHIEARRRLLSG